MERHSDQAKMVEPVVEIILLDRNPAHCRIFGMAERVIVPLDVRPNADC